jgi:hypothetical protein
MFLHISFLRPKTFVTRSKALELLYVVETMEYAITYAPLDALLTTSPKLRTASIVNRAGNAIYPYTKNIQASMKVSAEEEHDEEDDEEHDSVKHNFVEITDSAEAEAYPLSLLTYLLVREFYYVEGSTDGCKRVSEMIQVRSILFNDSSGIGISMTQPQLKSFSQMAGSLSGKIQLI